MEYKFFKKIQGFPYFIRIILGVFFMIFGVIATLVPGIPGAVLGFIIGLLFFVSAKKVKKVIKIRKGMVYLLKNFFNKKKWKHKWRDIKTHLHHIIYHD